MGTERLVHRPCLTGGPRSPSRKQGWDAWRRHGGGQVHTALVLCSCTCVRIGFSLRDLPAHPCTGVYTRAHRTHVHSCVHTHWHTHGHVHMRGDTCTHVHTWTHLDRHAQWAHSAHTHTHAMLAHKYCTMHICTCLYTCMTRGHTCTHGHTLSLVPAYMHSLPPRHARTPNTHVLTGVYPLPHQNKHECTCVFVGSVRSPQGCWYGSVLKWVL